MTPYRAPQVPLVRAVRGPIMLMLLGALFALDHFTAYNIGRTWPLLLIVFGLLLLLARVVQPAPVAMVAAPPPDSGGVQ